MGFIERKIIRLFEPILYRPSTSYESRPRANHLPIGMAQAAYGKKGIQAMELNVQERLRHLLRLGATGSGKSVGELGNRLQDVRKGQPFLMLDCHDTIDKLVRLVARDVIEGRIKEQTINNIYLVAPKERDWTVVINPYECLNPTDAPYKVGPIIEVLDVIWGDILGAQTLQFTRALKILMAEGNIPMSATARLLDDPAELRAHAMALNHSETREYFLSRFLSWSPRRRSQVAEAYLNKIGEFLAHPGIAAMLSSAKSDLDFRKAMDDGKTVLISLDKAELFGSVDLLASLILVSLRQATFSRGDLPEHERQPYFIVIEEFPSFASSVTVEPFLNESRKFGVGLVLIAQTLASVHGSLLSSLRANCLTQIIFRVSPEDAKIIVAGLAGEEKELIYRQLVSLPIGTAIVIQGGCNPQKLSIPNVQIPEKLTSDEEDIINQIRHNIGRPIPAPSMPPSVSSVSCKEGSIDIVRGSTLATGALNKENHKIIDDINNSIVEGDL